MHVSDSFSKMVRAASAAAVLIMLGFLLTNISTPRQSASAQNAGTVGIQAKLIPVFFNQATTAHSAILADIGQGVNILFFCTTAFQGSIDLEWAPPPNNNTFLTLAIANYAAPADTGCHTITVNGYFPNLRASLTRTAGSVNAWYSASSGPVGFAAPAVGTNGTTSPVTCDQAGDLFISSASNQSLSPNTGTFMVICGMTYSFQAATTTGNVSFGWAPNSGCTLGDQQLIDYTTSATPQTFFVGQTFRSHSSATNPTACWVNTSGSAMSVSFSYAFIQSP